ncbi:hypothetical protein [Sphingobacterium deserti]|uniref:Ferric uptake regulator family protein n=1 Tax=Sphingobacterium deserti TaxID=1229276 RepID=A0A0B8T4X1_9SPHI|nr:hypothetical protein [Sphingobacterium deserti]KGE12354.1 hypothetical protein DI53_3843 [Sphingobacterium deserti]
MTMTIENTPSKWIQQLKDRGHSASRQRILIMTALSQKRVIDDMESFWLELRQEHAISWATFYSFIRLAVKENWIAKHGKVSTYARYQLLID